MSTGDIGYSVCESIAAALVNDSAIKTACRTYFGKEPGIYIGFDPANPPGAENTPWIAIVPAASTIDESMDTREYELQIGFSAFYTTIDSSIPGIVKHDGYKKVYAVIDLIQSLIYSTLQPSQINGNVATTIKDLGRPSVDFAHPRYLASWTVRVASAF